MPNYRIFSGWYKCQLIRTQFLLFEIGYNQYKGAILKLFIFLWQDIWLNYYFQVLKYTLIQILDEAYSLPEQCEGKKKN